MPETPVDLTKLFQMVASSLAEKKDVLNEADSFNKNHGDNMVEIFELISKAAAEVGSDDAGKALSHASVVLQEQAKSGSAKLYAQGLASAAKKFESKQVTPQNGLELVQSLLGAEGVDLGQIMGGEADFLGPLLSGLTGQKTEADKPGLDAGDLLSAGLSFMQSTQAGQNPLEALMDGLVSGSPLSGSSHRTVSGKIVGNTLLQLLGHMLK